MNSREAIFYGNGRICGFKMLSGAHPWDLEFVEEIGERGGWFNYMISYL
jgi:hypothetical protein